MAELTQENLPKGIRNLFSKGYSAAEAGNYDYAIDLLLKCVELSPEFLRGRRTLRLAEVARCKKGKGVGGLSAKLASITGIGGVLKARGLIKKDPLKAVLAAEGLLKDNPLHVPFVRLFADAAVAAEMPEAATMTLTIARDELPGNVVLAKHLGKLYQDLNDHAAAKACFEMLYAERPEDPEVGKLLNDAMARASMTGDGWDNVAKKGGSSREMMANKDDALQQERKNKAMKSTEDVQALIDDLRQKIEDEPGNLNYRRELARLLRQDKQFDEALKALEEARETNPGDPELDRMTSETRKQQYDMRIAELREGGEEEQATELENERNQFVFDDLQDRVKRYPNDAHLRFELGCEYFKYEYIDESIQQLQLAQKSPKDRTMALYYLGRAFKAKGQNDMALMQFEEASKTLPRMDDQKKDIVYEMGTVCEALGDADRALNYYKQVYSVDIGYRDVSDRVEKAYAAKAQSSE